MQETNALVGAAPLFEKHFRVKRGRGGGGGSSCGGCSRCSGAAASDRFQRRRGLLRLGAYGISSCIQHSAAASQATSCTRHALQHHLLIHSTVKKVLASSPQYTFSSNIMETGAADANPWGGG